MMNLDEHNTAVLIRSLLSAIKHLENMNAILVKEIKKNNEDASALLERLNKVQKDRDDFIKCANDRWLEIKKLKNKVEQFSPKPKRGRGRPRKVQP